MTEPVTLLVDSYPTMQVWQERVADLRRRLAPLGDGTPVTQISLDLNLPPDLPALTGMVVIVSDGASPVWNTPGWSWLLRYWAQTRPMAIINPLSPTQWYRTGIDPTPTRIRVGEPGDANVRWEWRGSLWPEHPTEVVPVPVVDADRGPSILARLMVAATSEDDPWTSVASLLLSGSNDGPADPGPGAEWSPKRSVEQFKAAVPPVTFQLATYLAAVPLKLSLMQDLRERLLPRSTAENLAELLISPFVRADPTVADDQGSASFSFEAGVRQELLASARRWDIERVVQAVSERPDPSPGVAAFTSVLDRPAPTPTQGSPTSDELQWRRTRALVLLALSGPYFRQGERELQALPAEETTGPRPNSPDPLEGTPVKSEVETPTSTGVSVSSTPPTGRPLPTVVGDYPLRNPNFTGRGDLLTQLFRSLRSEAGRGAPPEFAGVTAVLPHALHGMGGVGKSLLAIEYIYRHASEYDVVWWIPSERTTSIQASLIMLGQRLGLPVANEANAGVPVVLDALRRGEPFGKWLLVFDNAESPEQVTPFLPKGGTGHILITSRDARWSQVALPLEVNVFTRDESKELLLRRGPDIDDSEADQLADALGDLPLAIEQAAAWHAETGMPAQEYLRLLREKQTELLDQPAPLDYETPVIAAWNVSLDHLEARSPEALQLLQVCAFFAAEPIPRTVLTAAKGENVSEKLDATLRNPIKFSRAIRDISRYSLARIDHRTNAIQMHRLVQAALIARMSPDEQEHLRHAAHRILVANDPGDPENPEKYPIYSSLYPHMLSSNAVECHEPWVRALVINEAKYLYRWGDHGASVELSERAHQTWTAASGDADSQTLEIGRWLGFVLFVVGRYQEAAELNGATLAVYERLAAAGEPHPDGQFLTLTNVAIDRRAQGEFGQALEISDRVLTRSIQAYGETDPETLNAAHNLAVSLRLSGLFARALERDEDTYQKKVEVFGADHPLTLITRLGLLVDLRELGNYKNAEKLHEFELTHALAVNGEQNPITLLARRLLAVAHRKAGHHEAARQTSLLVSSQLLSRYGDLHPETMAAQSNYAIDLRQVGELEKAQELGSDIVSRYAQALGEFHPHTVSAQVNLAITHRLLDDAALALTIDTAAHEALAGRLGENHPSTLVAATNRASDLYATGDQQAALEQDQATWERLVAVFGPDHPTTLACESNLADDLRRLGRDNEALTHHEHAVSQLIDRLGEGHQAVADAQSWEDRANCDLDPMPL